MKDIILFHPKTLHENNYSAFWLPYSVLAIASVVDLTKFNVRIIDDNIENINNLDDYLNKINLNNVFLVGASCMIGKQIKGALDFIKAVKKINRNIPSVVGGPAATFVGEQLLVVPSIDYVIEGQGEVPFDNLIKALSGEVLFEDVPSLLYKKGNKILINPTKSLEQRFNLPKFNFDLIDVNKYIQSDKTINSKTLNYISSQGCPFGCSFCSDTHLYSCRWLHNSVDNILRDLSYLVNNYDINGIKFYDSNLCGNLAFFKELVNKLIESDLGIKWGCAIHPKTFLSFSEEFILKLRKSGCSRLLIGLESGSEKTLQKVNKLILPEDSIKIAQTAKDNNIVCSFTFIVGFPFENSSDIVKTFDLAGRIGKRFPGHDLKIHIYAPFPNTKLFSESIQAGFVPPKTIQDWINYDYYSKTTNFIEEKFINLARNFNISHNSNVKGEN